MRFKNKCVPLALAAFLVLSCGGQPDRGNDAAGDDPVTLALATVQEYVDGYVNGKRKLNVPGTDLRI